MQPRQRRRLSRVEPLENRLALSGVSPAGVFNPPPPPVEVVQPTAPGLAPILLPPGLATPPGTTLLPAPPPGQLPPGLSPLAGNAEQLAVGALEGFATAHPGAQTNVRDFTSLSGRILLVVSMSDGASYANYLVSEGTDGDVVVGFGENDLVTGISEMISANEHGNGYGSSFMVQSQNGVFQSLTFVAEAGGHLTTSVYTPPPPAQT